jgi:hypothetical protein
MEESNFNLSVYYSPLLAAPEERHQGIANSETCTANQGPTTRSQGMMYWYNVGAPFKRTATDIARPFPESKRGNPVPPDCRGQLHQVTRGLCHSKPRGINSGGCPCDQLFLQHSKQGRSLSLDSCKRCCSTWGWQTAWWNNMWRRLRRPKGCFSATEKLGEGTHLPAGLQSINPWDHRHGCLPAWCSGGSHDCPVTCYSELPLAMWWTLWINCKSSTIMPVNIWKWWVTGWRPTVTIWLVPLDSRKTMFGCTVWPRPEGSHKSSSHHGKAHTRWSPRSTMWSPRYSNILGRRWWQCTWTDWRRTYGYSERAALRREKRCLCRCDVSTAWGVGTGQHMQARETPLPTTASNDAHACWRFWCCGWPEKNQAATTIFQGLYTDLHAKINPSCHDQWAAVAVVQTLLRRSKWRVYVSEPAVCERTSKAYVE